jgi:hypothetical protein
MRMQRLTSLAVMLFLMLSIGAGCGKSLQQRIEQAKGMSVGEEMRAEEKAEQDAQNEYLDEWQSFRSGAVKQIAANEKSLEDLSAQSAATGGKLDATLTGLQQKNDDLKKRLQGYQDEGKVGWDAFKRDFSHDLDGLDKALRAEEGKKDGRH